jgi:DNA (cytosine-5)-methyltransferase 1
MTGTNSLRDKSAATGRNVSAVMRKVKSANTEPEIILRRALWAEGLRYKICPASLPGKPDIVLPSKRLVIFIDGDLWHGNQWKLRKLSSLEEQFGATESRDYWLRKIRRNMQRDCATTAALMAQGWTVLRFWESEIKTNLNKCVKTIMKTIERDVVSVSASLLPQKTCAEFFAGIGLMRAGLEKQGWSVSFANDLDPQKMKMYREHFADAENHFLLDDIHNLDARDIKPVTLATASFPCNDLSLAGARNGLAGRQSSAFWGFIRILERWKKFRPPLVLLENVTGFLTSHQGEDFTAALLALNQLGYAVDAFINDAVNFVPQSRPRLFVIGALESLSDQQQDKHPAQLSADSLRPQALTEFIASHPEIRWRIRNLPSPPQGSLRLDDILEDLPETSAEWWSQERAEYLLNQMSPRHRRIADSLIASPEWSYGTVFRRIRNGRSMAELRTDGIAGCLRTPRGGSGRQILFKAGKGKYMARLLTPRECAMLMGADDYEIAVPRNQALFGFGDAVCVPVIEWIAQYYLNPVVSELIRACPLRAISQRRKNHVSKHVPRPA